MSTTQLMMVLVAVLLIIIAVYIVPRFMNDETWREKGFKNRLRLAEREDEGDELSPARVNATPNGARGETTAPQPARVPDAPLVAQATTLESAAPARGPSLLEHPPTAIEEVPPPRPTRGLILGKRATATTAPLRETSESVARAPSSERAPEHSPRLIPEPVASVRRAQDVDEEPPSAGDQPTYTRPHLVIEDNDDESDEDTLTMPPGSLGQLGNRLSNAVKTLIKPPSPSRLDESVDGDPDPRDKDPSSDTVLQDFAFHAPETPAVMNHDVASDERDDDVLALDETQTRSALESRLDVPIKAESFEQTERFRAAPAGKLNPERFVDHDDPDDDDGEIDLSGMGLVDAEERRQIIEELEREREHPELVEIEEEKKLAKLKDADEATNGKVYAWTSFIGEDATRLKDDERRALVKNLEEIDEPYCADILLEAFYQEEPAALRPDVLRAITTHYNSDGMRDIYHLCLTDGTDEEKALAQSALAELEAVR